MPNRVERAPQSVDRLRVLLIDADDHAATNASKVLVSQGCHATLVCDEAQAHRVAEAVRPHLLLIRVDQPDRAVIATIARFKAGNSGFALRFGCLSLHPDAMSSHKFLNMGFDYVLKVPVEAQALQAVVGSVLRQLPGDFPA